MEIKGILFDLGGTLFSYERSPEMGRTIFRAAKSIGVDVEPREIGSAWRAANESVMRSFAERDYFLHRDLFLETLRTFAVSFDATVPDEVAEEFHAKQLSAVVDHLPIRPDCLETLAHLKRRGLYLAIVSNIDDDYLDPLVEKHGLDGVLDHWTSSEEARSCKPHTGIYHYALEKGGLGATETLFVGDSLHHDIAGANAAGLRSARIVEEGVTTPLTSGLKVTAQPEYEIDALAQLIDIVESVNAG